MFTIMLLTLVAGKKKKKEADGVLFE